MLCICEKTRGISFHACWLCLCAVCVSETKAYMAVLVCCVCVKNENHALAVLVCCVIVRKQEVVIQCMFSSLTSHSALSFVIFFIAHPYIHTHIPSANHITQLTIFIKHTHLQLDTISSLYIQFTLKLFWVLC